MKPSRRAFDDKSKTRVDPSPNAIREQLGRVLASDSFRQSRRMADLLRFIVSESLAGNDCRLKEYVIAVEVFDRDESFDPRTNALVRVEASRLRHRLREFSLGPGCGDPIQIELPAGSYVPHFRTVEQRASAAGNSSSPAGSQREALLDLSEKPSIAALPFAFLGDGQPQRLLVDGMTEDLIVALSRIHWLLVIPCSSTVTYKSRRVNVRLVGREMGVRYVLKGSVRRVGDRIRVCVELSDATTGNVLSAHRYDRELSDIFQLQEVLAETIAAEVEFNLLAAERERAFCRPSEDLDAWGLYQRGVYHMYRFTSDDSRSARRLFHLAAAADSRFASPFGALAYLKFLDFVLGFTDAPRQTIAEAVEAGRAAIERDESDPMAHFGMGRALSLAGKLDSAMNELEIAIDLKPNFAPAYLGVGGALSLAGRHREAIGALDVAIRLSPHDPMLWTMEHMRAFCHIELEEFDQAVEDARLASRHSNTSAWSYVTLASALSNLDRGDEAREVRDALFERWPDFSMSRFARAVPFDAAVASIWRGGLTRAGLNNV
jgi:adenylate cyclase